MRCPQTTRPRSCVKCSSEIASGEGTLRLRLASRMGQYSRALGEVLNEIVHGGPETKYVYKLAPIRLVDVRAMLNDRHSDPGGLLQRVLELGIGPLIAKPFHPQPIP